MKNIITTAIFTAVAMLVFSAVQAQSESKYRTDIPISQQLKKGTVSGAQFAPVTTQLNIKPAPKAPEANIRESFSKRLQKGAIQGFKYQTGGGAVANAVAPKQAATNVTLASSLPVGKEEKKKTELKPVTLPSQDDKGALKANN